MFGAEPADDAIALPFETPLAALEAAVLPALERPPCLVSFSGGRDSSCVLAVAVNVARREGLQLPVPATHRFRGATEADESEWQERVVSALRLADWVRLEQGDELDVVGSVAERVLAAHGLLWPFNVHFHLPLLEEARGGALLTGIGGDEIFGLTSWDRVNAVLARVVRPKPKDVLRASFAVTPPAVRRRILRRRFPQALPWLRPRARRAVADAWAAQAALEPRRYTGRAAWWRRLRATRVGLASLAVLASDEDVLLVHALADASLADAIARTPALVHADRAGRMRALVGSLLADAVYERRSKASFDRVFWGVHSRELAREWRGEGIDPNVVDAEALRSVWAQEVPPPQTYTLLQSVWLARATEARSGGARPPAPATTSGEDVGARTPAERKA